MRLVSEIMNENVIVIDGENTISEILDLFQKNETRHVFVVEGGLFQGVVSDRNVYRALSPFIATRSESGIDTSTLQRTATEIMTQENLITVKTDTSLKEAADLLINHGISCLPVVSEENKLMGMITWVHFLKVFELDKLIKEVMTTKQIVTINMDDRLRRVKKIFDEYDFHHLPVIEDRELVGIISDKDLLKVISPFFDTDEEREQDRDIAARRVHHIMSRNPQTVTMDTPIREACELMAQHHISSLSVVDSENRLDGIFTWRDFLRCFLEE